MTRFRDLLVLSASLAVWAGSAVGFCNRDFVAVWTKGKGQVIWNDSNNLLIALLLIVNSTRRCCIAFISITKQIHVVKYIYLFEGISFVGLSLLVAPICGMNGIIASALLTNICWSCVYGSWRVKDYFGIPETRSVLAWLRPPLWYLVLLAAILGAVTWVSNDWNTLLRLSVMAGVAASAGPAICWQLGLTPPLRVEALGVLGNLRDWVRPVARNRPGR